MAEKAMQLAAAAYLSQKGPFAALAFYRLVEKKRAGNSAGAERGPGHRLRGSPHETLARTLPPEQRHHP
jgi:hypothetical protein